MRGLLDIIARLVTTYEPTDLVSCWDDDWRPQWRFDLIPSYKSHRLGVDVAAGLDVEVTPDPLEVQIPIIREVLDAWASRGRAPHYEADDMIGTLATAPRSRSTSSPATETSSSSSTTPAKCA